MQRCGHCASKGRQRKYRKQEISTNHLCLSSSVYYGEGYRRPFLCIGDVCFCGRFVPVCQRSARDTVRFSLSSVSEHALALVRCPLKTLYMRLTFVLMVIPGS